MVVFDFVLIDGNKIFKDLIIFVEVIVKGDVCLVLIVVVFIVVKIFRDGIMEFLV